MPDLPKNIKSSLPFLNFRNHFIKISTFATPVIPEWKDLIDCNH